MSKDLTKEYKEAVMNDLPDLWGRIEAAIDAQENEKNNEIKSETVKKEETETIKTESNIKLVGNETVKETVIKKKRRMPVWLVTAVPFAAILLVVIVPLSLFGRRCEEFAVIFRCHERFCTYGCRDYNL